MNKPPPDQIAKLPKWAQEYVKDLERRVVVSERALKEYQDAQTPSEFFVEELLCVGEGGPKFSKRYIQTDHISIVNKGVRVDVLIRPEDPCIEVSWSDDQRTCTEVAMVPFSFQRIRLKTKANMRD